MDPISTAFNLGQGSSFAGSSEASGGDQNAGRFTAGGINRGGVNDIPPYLFFFGGLVLAVVAVQALKGGK